MIFTSVLSLCALCSTATARILQQVALPVLSSAQCKRHWGNRITNSMICAGANGVSICNVTMLF